MKKQIKVIMFVAFGLFMAAGQTLAQNVQRQVTQRDYDEIYTTDGNHVYYRGEVLNDVDVNTFVFLGHGYAKDNRHVFYNGRIMKNVNPNTFRLYKNRNMDYGDNCTHGNSGQYQRSDSYDCEQNTDNVSWGYSKNSFDVFFRGKKIEDASANSFQVLSDGYAKDSFSAYYLGNKIENSTGGSFEALSWGYSKDSFNVYYHGCKIDGAMSGSFNVQQDGYAKDDFNVYYWGKKINS